MGTPLTELLLFIVSLLPFYLLGAFPTGHLVARAYGVAIEEHGSGNVGATNVLRTIGKKAGALTFGGDFVKGILATLIGGAIGGSTYGAYAGLAAVCGHCFSIPGRLKGGKGVATAFGVFLVCWWVAALGSFGAFAVTLRLKKIVSLASITAALTAPIVAILSGAPDTVLPPLGTAALLVVWRHRSNLQRLIEGTEPTTRPPVSPPTPQG